MKTKVAYSRTSFPKKFMILCALILTCSPASAEPIKHQITGLFMPEREQDLREACAQLMNIKLVSIDFKNAEATFDYVPAKVFPNVKPERALQIFDEMLQNASHHAFGIKPLRSVPLEKLHKIDISVAGLDCKACTLVAYEAVYKLDGVEKATASFREGRVSAWMIPGKADRAMLEKALQQRGVTVKAP